MVCGYWKENRLVDIMVKRVGLNTCAGSWLARGCSGGKGC